MAWPASARAIRIQYQVILFCVYLNVYLNPILAWLCQDQMVIRALLLKVLALTRMMKKILEERLRFIGLLDRLKGFVQYWNDRPRPNHSSTRQTSANSGFDC